MTKIMKQKSQGPLFSNEKSAFKESMTVREAKRDVATGIVHAVTIL